MHLRLNQMDDTSARAILGWRYEEPYSFYNPNPAEVEKDLEGLINPRNLYFAAIDERDLLVAYYCFGPEARVPGGDYSAEPEFACFGTSLAYFTAGRN